MARVERVVTKVRADSVPFGTDVSRNGFVWAAYENGELLCIAPTAKEARSKAYDAKARLDAARRVAEGQPQHIDTTGVAQEIPLKY